MLMKRHYNIPDGWTPILDEAKNVTNPLPLEHIEVLHTGTHAEQNFSTRFVEVGVAASFISISKGKIIIHAEPEDLVYDIVRGPGYYCCHCGATLADAGMVLEPGVTIGTKHVADEHAGAPPSTRSPSGYERINHYETVLGTAQHAKFRIGAKHG